MNEYELFHTTRIMNILMEQQTPYNRQGDHGVSSGGNFRLFDRKEKVNKIVDSMFEIGLITWEERSIIRGVLK